MACCLVAQPAKSNAHTDKQMREGVFFTDFDVQMSSVSDVINVWDNSIILTGR